MSDPFEEQEKTRKANEDRQNAIRAANDAHDKEAWGAHDQHRDEVQAPMKDADDRMAIKQNEAKRRMDGGNDDNSFASRLYNSAGCLKPLIDKAAAKAGYTGNMSDFMGGLGRAARGDQQKEPPNNIDDAFKFADSACKAYDTYRPQVHGMLDKLGVDTGKADNFMGGLKNAIGGGSSGMPMDQALGRMADKIKSGDVKDPAKAQGFMKGLSDAYKNNQGAVDGFMGGYLGKDKMGDFNKMMGGIDGIGNTDRTDGKAWNKMLGDKGIPGADGLGGGAAPMGLPDAGGLSGATDIAGGAGGAGSAAGAATAGASAAPVLGTAVDAVKDTAKDLKKIKAKYAQKKADRAQAKAGDEENIKNQVNDKVQDGIDGIGQKAEETKAVVENVGAGVATEAEIAALDAAFGAGEVIRAIPGASKLLRKANKLIIGAAIMLVVAVPLTMCGFFIASLGFIGLVSSMIETNTTKPVVADLTQLAAERMETDRDYRMLALGRVETLISDHRIPDDIHPLLDTVLADGEGTTDEYSRIATLLAEEYMGVYRAYAADGTTPTKLDRAQHYMDGSSNGPEVTALAGSASWLAKVADWVTFGSSLQQLVAMPEFEEYFDAQQRTQIAELYGIINTAYAETDPVAVGSAYQAASASTLDAPKKCFSSTDRNYVVNDGDVTLPDNQVIVDAMETLKNLLSGVSLLGINQAIADLYDQTVGLELFTALNAAKSGFVEGSSMGHLASAIAGGDKVASTSPSWFDWLGGGIALALVDGKYGEAANDGFTRAAEKMIEKYHADPKSKEWQTDFLNGDYVKACQEIVAAGKMDIYYEVNCQQMSYIKMIESYIDPLGDGPRTVSCTGGMPVNAPFDPQLTAWINASSVSTGVYAPLIAAVITLENSGATTFDKQCEVQPTPPNESGLMQLGTTPNPATPDEVPSWDQVKDQVASSPMWSKKGTEVEPLVCDDNNKTTGNEDTIFGGGYFIAARLQSCASCAQEDGSPCVDPADGEPWCTPDQVLPSDSPSEEQIRYIGYRYTGSCDPSKPADLMTMEVCDGTDCKSEKKTYCDWLLYFTKQYGDAASGYTAPQCTVTGTGGGGGGIGAGPNLMANVTLFLEDNEHYGEGMLVDVWPHGALRSYPNYRNFESNEGTGIGDYALCADFVMAVYQHTNSAFKNAGWADRGAENMINGLVADGVYHENGGYDAPQVGDIAGMNSPGESGVHHVGIICEIGPNTLTICQYNSRNKYHMEFIPGSNNVYPGNSGLNMLGWGHPCTPELCP
ncbi:hypothetical protein AUK40_03030 [Candidatus Wirthbacteria bacterium CG2_30_54_11]|uniref:Uncharacterized protein n=1 Tax=Candidatus Wirthbacteria bacterium CG2_30_54_11 TaxID=1817892 RepID=A0A1J5J251_9BACT|nr:MAG: hypothetical protein AUK40_03030 [Candidatus Wirthbacteria bacterium CG2_30_54_11]